MENNTRHKVAPQFQCPAHSDDLRAPRFQQRKFHTAASYCISGNPRPLCGHSIFNKLISKETEEGRQGAETIEGEKEMNLFLCLESKRDTLCQGLSGSN